MSAHAAEFNAPGLVNLRDIGGLTLVGGGVTATGVLYRGDAPYPGDSAVPDLESWPPASIVDLRGVRERARFAYQWAPDSVVHHVPMFDAAAPDAAPTDLAAVFVRMLNCGEIWAGDLLRAVSRSRGATLVHCTAGKDRTGVAVAVLLLAAGVEPTAVVADFVRSEDALDSLHRRWIDAGVRKRDSPPLPEKYMHAPVEAIEPVIEQLSATPGGPAQWMLDNGADPADLDNWRARLRGGGEK
ncbi:protein tyrosine phosphatase [Rhodococcus sp. ACS1]|uniref:tyrosine-protein phosphatase n=1 Tax=Rhodococcus sp. ACS1 TaxID=2028570 RepID=UPI000BB0D5D7|nr:tyrosine-protein phosphatase [Rhodococcus sp. ACS1]PBC47972.1 protein tyrosine phosphatase [Rhodococcus sp. ACS1]